MVIVHDDLDCTSKYIYVKLIYWEMSAKYLPLKLQNYFIVPSSLQPPDFQTFCRDYGHGSVNNPYIGLLNLPSQYCSAQSTHLG